MIPIFVIVSSLCIAPRSRKDTPSAVLLTFQGGMACPQLNSWRPGGEQDTEERSLASHRQGDREERQTDRQRMREREREEWTWIWFRLTLKSPVKVFSSSSMTHTCTHLARWTRTHSLIQHMHTSSLWRCSEPHWCRTKSPQWRQVSQRERERERGREREREGGISIILSVTDDSKYHSPPRFQYPS